MRVYDHENSRASGNKHLDTIREAVSKPDPARLALDEFVDILSEAEIDDITMPQASKLYGLLGGAIGADFLEERLSRRRKKR